MKLFTSMNQKAIEGTNGKRSTMNARMKILAVGALLTAVLTLAVAVLSPKPAAAYDSCQCTGYAWSMRQDLPSLATTGVSLGDAWQWAANAAQAGFLVDGTPQVGDIAVFPPNIQGAGALGHVAYVDAVYSGTSFHISERNFDPLGLHRPCIFNTRNANTSGGVLFIHRRSSNTYSVSLSASSTSVSAGSGVTLTARSNVDVGPTPYWITILQNGSVAAYCGSGTSCSYTANSSSATSRTYVARISATDGSSSHAQSSSINVTWIASSATYSVSLSASSTSVSAGSSVTLTARSNVDVGPTPYWITILQNGSVAAYCGSGTSCSYTANSSSGTSRTYVARISAADGSSSQAQSPSIDVTWSSASQPAQPGPAGYTYCASEGQRCSFSGTKDVAYGANGAWRYSNGVTGGIDCNNNVFGDPVPGVVKACFIKDSVSTPGGTAGSDRMQSGQYMLAGQSITSGNGCYNFIYQTDGNLVLYRTSNHQALWASNTAGRSTSRAHMQADGNLVVYDANGSAAWASNTAGNSGAWLNAQNDGNVVIYRTNGSAAWATNTVQSSCATSGSIDPNAWYSVVNRNSGKCVDARNGSAGNGTAIQQYSCNGSDAQKFQFQPTGSGYYRVVRRGTAAQVWDVTGASPNDGGLIQLWNYGGGNNQQWYAESLGGGYWRFKARHTGKCLDVPGASTSDWLQLQQYSCNGTNAQSFTLAP